MYIWERDDWPGFTWDPAALLTLVADATLERGRLYGVIDGLGLEGQQEIQARALTEDTGSTSAIEGEDLPPASVRSSVVRRLGMDAGGLPEPSRRVDGLVAMLDDATSKHDEPLTAERMHGWHAGLFPTGHSLHQQIRVASWRVAPIRIRSFKGPMGSQVERVHFEGPPPERVPSEMTALLEWFGETARSGEIEGVVRAGLAHLWFETIHPYEDGNGRIGRALADMALAQADGLERRVYSVSGQIKRARPAYYEHLERAQNGALDVTDWLVWWVECVRDAVAAAAGEVDTAVWRGEVWRSLTAEVGLNPRQIKAVLRMVDAEPEGFQGGMSREKYASLTRTSLRTATRDLAQLVERGWLEPLEGGGRSARYQLAALRTTRGGLAVERRQR